jgi:hypothetical protein
VNEVFDYNTSKPFFEKWSETQFKASMGKSYGNVRAMHGKSASGIVKEPITFNDEGKTIEGVVYVVDDQDWKKVLTGTYTGISIGGDYVDRWPDPTMGKGVYRYTANPSEVSLVDNPCNGDATFMLIKADGSTTLQKFHTEPAAAAKAPPTEASSASTVSAEPPIDPRAEVAQVWKAKDGSTFPTKAEAVSHNVELAKAAVAKDAEDAARLAAAPVQAALDALGKSILPPNSEAKPAESDSTSAAPPTDQPSNATSAEIHPTTLPAKTNNPAEGTVSDDEARTFTPDTVLPSASQAVAASIDTSVNTPPNPPAVGVELVTAKTQLSSLWKWKGESAFKTDAKASLAKSLYTVGSIAYMLEEMGWIKDSLCWEEKLEGDASTLPDKFQGIIDEMCMFLQQLVVEETSEMMSNTALNELIDATVTGDEDGVVLVIENAAQGRAAPMHKALSKIPTPDEKLTKFLKSLEKVAMRHSVEDMGHLQAAHDHIAKMLNGDCCSVSKANARNSKADADRLTAAHDLLTAAGAGCGMYSDASNSGGDGGDTASKALAAAALAKAASASTASSTALELPVLQKFEKLEAENTELKKVLAGLTPQVEALAAEVKKIADTPMPAKGYKGPLSAVQVNKNQDNGGLDISAPGLTKDQVAEYLGKMSDEQRAMLLMKVSLANPNVKT